MPKPRFPRRARRFSSGFAAAMATCLLILLSACRSAAGSDELRLDDLAQLVVEEEMRIGSRDDPDYGFSRVGAVDVDRDGVLYLFEAQDMQVRAYDPSGRLIHRFGRRGGGPGEFEGFVRMGLVGDTVWTYDGQPRRITLFSRDGTLLSTGTAQPVSIPFPGGRIGSVLPVSMRPDGLFISDLMRISYGGEDPPGVKLSESTPVPRVVFDVTGVVVDTVGWDASPPPRMVPPPDFQGRFEVAQLGTTRFTVPQPSTGLADWHPLHDGRIIFEQPVPTQPEASLIVTRLELDGDTVYSRVIHYDASPFTSEVLDSLAAQSARYPGGMNVIRNGLAPSEQPFADPLAVRAIREKMNFPEYRTPIQYSWLGNDDGMWLRRDQDGAESRWVLLAADGLPRGELSLHSNARVVWASGDTFWAVVPDELDVPWLVRYRIRADDSRGA